MGTRRGRGQGNLNIETSAEQAQRRNLKKYANLYVKKKAVLMPLIAKYSEEPINPDATHGELIRTYIHLLKSDPDFGREVEGLMDRYNNVAVDPVSAVAEAVGQIAGVFGQFKEGSNIRDQAEADQEAMLYGMILSGQKDNSTRNILIISGVSLLMVGALIFAVSKSKKHK